MPDDDRIPRGRLFRPVQGRFFRAVDPAYRAAALAGSRTAGRYSRQDQPTLYLSSTPEGVNAAMTAHAGNRSETLEILQFDVRAARIFDLRDRVACAAAGIELRIAMAPWQDLVARGEAPGSWALRDRLERMGAEGLIDPSRQIAGLWHLVLFAWNRSGAPEVIARP